jgi:hypothetical protein
VTTVSASTSVVTLAAADSSRQSLWAYNQSTSNMWISTVSGFAAANAPTLVPPNSSWKLPCRFTGNVYAVWDAAVGQATVLEV